MPALNLNRRKIKLSPCRKIQKCETRSLKLPISRNLDAKLQLLSTRNILGWKFGVSVGKLQLPATPPTF